MKYPSLVPKVTCRTPIHVSLAQEGLNKYGEQLEPVVIDTLCNYQDNAKTILTEDKKMITLNGCAMFNGDIAPELSVISGGTVMVHGVERNIFRGMKARNMDGTVNYTRLDLE